MENNPLAANGQMLGNPKNQLILIEVLVIVTFSLLVIQGVLGVCRRHFYCRPLKYVVVLLNMTIPALISYILGLMRSSDISHELVSTWAAFLVFIYAGGDHYVLLINDNLINGLVAVGKCFLYVIYSIFLIPYVKKLSVLLPLIFLLATSFVRLIVTLFHPRATLSSLCDIWDERQKEIVSSGSRGEDDNPSLSVLQRCRYVVNPTHRKKKGGQEGSIQEPTVSDIWCCQDRLILSSTGDEETERSKHMKRTCLSFSFFWLLVHKFVGIPVYGRRDQKDAAWNMVRHGLLEDGLTKSDPLGVIEDELTFLGDLFTNKDFFLYNRIGFLWYPVAQGFYIGCLCWTVVIIFRHYDPKNQAMRTHYHNYDVEVLVTEIVSTCILFWEFLTLIYTLSSPRWIKVALICTYVRRGSWNQLGLWYWCIKKAANYFCNPCRLWRGCCSPWGRQLQQYSLLHSCRRFESFDKLVLLRKALLSITRGEIYSKSITLSDDLKEKVIELLRDRGQHLTNGIDSLPEETRNTLEWAIPETHTDAQVILTWHIATSMCEMGQNDPNRGQDSQTHFHVAKSLSKYCAYLVAFAPELLPGNASITEHTWTTTIQEASSILKGCNEGDLHGKLMDVASKSNDVEAVQGNADVEAGQENDNVEAYQATIKEYGTIMQQGALLGIELARHIEDSNERWKLLANFWAEKILYLAPNIGNETAHAKRLVEGGEFITLLWVLLYHAGIVSRDCFRNRNNGDGGDGGGGNSDGGGVGSGGDNNREAEPGNSNSEGSSSAGTSDQHKAEKSTAAATTSTGEIEDASN